MAIIRMGDSQPIDRIQYGYRRHPDPRYIIIKNPFGAEFTYSVGILKKMASADFGMPAALQEMAQGALDYLGVRPSTEKPTTTITLTSIEGVKVYQDIRGEFIAFIGKQIRRSKTLTDLETKIKKLVGKGDATKWQP